MGVSYQHLYVHLPFCEVICHYCDFYTARTKGADHQKLFVALAAHLRRHQSGLAPKLRSLYFGGGTPSASPPGLLKNFLSLAPAAEEASLEANPNDLSDQKLHAWREAGFNRLSVGVQSLDPVLLKSLGRTHTAEQALDGIARAARIFPIVSADLIYAVPTQSEKAPMEDALKLREAGVKHLSAYHLTLEPEHFLHRKLPSDDHAFSQIFWLQEALQKAGLGQYEVSNFSEPGLESIHNRAYWLGQPYLALGPSGHSFDGGFKRWQNIPDWKEYARRLEQNESPVEFQETLTEEQRLIEYLFTSLRTRDGLPLSALKAEFLTNKMPLLKTLQKEGLGALD